MLIIPMVTSIPHSFYGNGDAWVMKIKSDGSPEWQYVYGGQGRDECRSIRPVNNGYIMVGFSNSRNGWFSGKNQGEFDIYVVKLDTKGIMQWQQVFGGENTDVGTGIRQTRDGETYVIAGYEDYSHSGKVCKFSEMSKAWIMAIHANDGTLKWKKSFGDSGSHGTSVVEDSDTNYILYGFAQSGSGIDGDYNIQLSKFDDQGNTIGSQQYGNNGLELTNYVHDDGIQVTSDGGLVFFGQSSSYQIGDSNFNHGNSDLWVVKLDENDQVEWQTLLGGTACDIAAGSIHEIPDPDGGYIVSGITLSSNSGDVGQNHGSYDIWVIKLDKSGKILWQETLGGAAEDTPGSIQPASDGGYIVSGMTTSSDNGDVGHNNGNSDAWVVKLPPHLVVDVEDSSTHSWVSDVNVILTDDIKKEDFTLNAIINGHVVFSGSGVTGRDKLERGKSYTVKSTADKYTDSAPVSFQYTHDGQLVHLTQTPLVTQYDNSFSITCIEHYDHICGKDGRCAISGSIDQCDNVASNLINAGYKMNFYHKDEEVTRQDFFTNPTYTGPTIVDSAFHYHSGHGGDTQNAGLPIHITALLLKGYSDITSISDYVLASDVSGKWGGKNKWVMLDSCNLLEDKTWGNALWTSHGILGYSTDSWVHQDFGDMFFGYAIDQKKPIVEAYKMTTIEIYHDDDHTGTAIARDATQIKMDQFPGIEGGHLEPDGDPANNQRYRYNWNCRVGGPEWWD